MRWAFLHVCCESVAGATALHCDWARGQHGRGGARLLPGNAFAACNQASYSNESCMQLAGHDSCWLSGVACKH